MPPAPLPAANAAAKAYNAFNRATFTIGAEAANVINVAVQLAEAKAGRNVGQRCVLKCYLADNADGHGLTATVPTSTVAIGTNGEKLAALVTDKAFLILTDASGRFDLNLTQTAAPVTYYLVVVLPDGSLTISSAITYA